MTLLWWHWLVLSLLLVLAELGTSGGFYFVFFGVGALVVGLLSFFGAAGPEWVQWLLFSGLSVGSLLIFRTRMLRWVQKEPQRPKVDALVGEVGVALEDLPPGAVGRVELRGTPWPGRNAAPVPIARGVRCRVVRVEGLTVHVEPEGAHT